MSRLLLILLIGLYAYAADTRLDSLRTLLMPMRGKQLGNPTRGASPQLTLVKHQMRDWVESRMAGLDRDTDWPYLAHQLNDDLSRAGLFCDSNADRCDWTALGHLRPLTFSRSGFLVLITGVGIDCGFDDSTYLYSWSAGGWQRVWQNEQNTYTEKGYKPQTIHSVLVSPYNLGNDYLILTLGTLPWCSSNWRNVYYRVFRPGPDLEAPPLIDAEEYAFLSDDPPIQGSVSATDVLVQFNIGSIDVGVHNRPAIRHFQIERDSVKRVGPLALRPRDFVDEWLTHKWTMEAAHWSEDTKRVAMADWHKKLHKDRVYGQFVDPTKHCRAKPDLWQVGIDLGDPPTPGDKPPVATYFTVRWRPPYQFTMVSIGDHGNPDCTETDPQGDDVRPDAVSRS